MDVLVISMRVRLNTFKPSSHPVFEDESKCCFVDVIDEMIKEALPTILSNNPLGTCLFHRCFILFDLESTIDEMQSMLDSTRHLKSFSWVSNL